jgi:tetratricopeptide (TPR) repeat protein
LFSSDGQQSKFFLYSHDLGLKSTFGSSFAYVLRTAKAPSSPPVFYGIEIAGDETNMKKETIMKAIHFLAGLSLSVLLSACAAIRGRGDVAQGRQALLKGNYQTALGLFQDAEKADPTYVYGTELRAGVSSYLGRTQYLTGNYAQARQTLEKAVSQHTSDNVARLYLGLTLYRLGDEKAALANIQGGMEGINNWLQYLNTDFALEFG